MKIWSNSQRSHSSENYKVFVCFSEMVQNPENIFKSFGKFCLFVILLTLHNEWHWQQHNNVTTQWNNPMLLNFFCQFPFLHYFSTSKKWQFTSFLKQIFLWESRNITLRLKKNNQGNIICLLPFPFKGIEEIKFLRKRVIGKH